ncbi:hypothetical protein EV383_1066 [Pseudonocardia sediminis]|uniref:VIT family protein n=1 Tax=Pseudonocardia sediminis TaxID=1397368 RepID=A0A4Q7UTM9_PSEST|nr:hypothetical protein [Pseudonocardia sediminis]RZT84228.1 hypothetical protein EV383_1066 [Pseudonocardia sediminis]
MSRAERAERATPAQISSILRERVYGTIACLSTLLVLTRHVTDGGGPWSAVADVLIATGGLWAASLFADYLAHLAAHGTGPEGHERLMALRSSGQILQASAVPVLLLVGSALGWPPFHTALWTAVWVLVASMGLFALLAVRRTTLPWWKRILLVVALVALGGLVVGLKSIH